MKAVFVLLATVVAVAVAKPADDAAFTTKYDNVDVDAIISNKRLFKNYFKCIMTGEKCTPDGQALRDAIPGALEKDCAQCSPKQKELTETFLPKLVNLYPAEWTEMRQKFDPENKYSQKYADLAKKHGIKV